MEILLYKRETFPRPLNRDGEFSDQPYSITVPNIGHLEKIKDYIPDFDNTTMVVALNDAPQYPVLEGDFVKESSKDYYKLQGLIPLETHERILDGEIIFTTEYTDSMKAEELRKAKLLKYYEAGQYKDQLRETYLVDFELNDDTFKHGIREKDINNITGAIITMNEAKFLTGEDISTVWTFKEAKSATLTKTDLVQLAITVQQNIGDLHTTLSLIEKTLRDMTTIEEVNAFDVKSIFTLD